MKNVDKDLTLLFAIFIAICIWLALAVKAWPAEVCFDTETAKVMTVELEQCHIQRDELSFCNEAVRNLNQTVEAQEAAMVIYKTAIEDARKAAEGYRSLLDEQRKIYETALKESRPSLFEQALKALGFIGGGIIIGVLL